MSTLRQHRITDYDHAARKVTKEDFRTFDYILAMDSSNLRDLLRVRESVIASLSGPAAGAGGKKGTRAAAAAALAADLDGEESIAGRTRPKIAEVRLFGDFRPDGTVHSRVGGGEEVEDPYYGGVSGFEEVYQQVTEFSKGFLAYLENRTGGSED
jgi:low molecular weight phosphotyrosine protein phosphatase